MNRVPLLLTLALAGAVALGLVAAVAWWKDEPRTIPAEDFLGSRPLPPTHGGQPMKPRW
mgnify:FL=1